MIRSIALILSAVAVACASAGTAPMPGDELALLKQQYLVCDREASYRRMSGDEAAACSVAAEQLLRRAFGGKLDQLLDWWRVERLPTAEATALFEQAQLRYETGHYVEAWTLFARLADCGHVASARIALQMQRLGPPLYGKRFAAEQAQLERWRSTLATPDAQQIAAHCTVPAYAEPDDGQEAAERTSERPVPPQVRADLSCRRC